MANRTETQYIESAASAFELPAGDSIKIKSSTEATGEVLAGIALESREESQALNKIAIENGGIQVTGSGYSEVYGINLGLSTGEFTNAPVAISFGNGKAAVSAAAFMNRAAGENTSAVAIMASAAIVLESPAALQGKIAATVTGGAYSFTDKIDSTYGEGHMYAAAKACGIIAKDVTFNTSGTKPAVEAVAKGAKGTFNQTLANAEDPTSGLNHMFDLTGSVEAIGIEAAVISATEGSRQLGGTVTAGAAGGTLAGKVKMIGGSDENEAAAYFSGTAIGGAIDANEITFGGIAADFKLKSVATAAKATYNLETASGSGTLIEAELNASAFGLRAETLTLSDGGLAGTWNVSATGGDLAANLKGDLGELDISGSSIVDATGIELGSGGSLGDVSDKFKLTVMAKGGTMKLAGKYDADDEYLNIDAKTSAYGIYFEAGDLTAGRLAGTISVTATGGTMKLAGKYDADDEGLDIDTETKAYGIYFEAGDLTAGRLAGTISVTATGGSVDRSAGGADAEAYGIYTYNGMVDFAAVDAGFKLTVKATGGARGDDSDAEAYGLYADAITIGGGTLNLTVTATAGKGDDADSEAYGLHTCTGITIGTEESFVVLNVNVTATGGNTEGGDAMPEAYGIYTYGGEGANTLYVTGKLTVTARGGTAGKGDTEAEAYGMSLSGETEITLTGQNTWSVTATGGKADDEAYAEAYGIYNNDVLTVAGTAGALFTLTVKATGGTRGYNGYTNAWGISAYSMSFGTADQAPAVKFTVTATSGAGFISTDATAYGFDLLDADDSTAFLSGSVAVTAKAQKADVSDSDDTSAVAQAFGFAAGSKLELTLADKFTMTVAATGGAATSSETTAQGIKADSLTLNATGKASLALAVTATGGKATDGANTEAYGLHSENDDAENACSLTGSITVTARGGQSLSKDSDPDLTAEARGIKTAGLLSLETEGKFTLNVSATGQQTGNADARGVWSESNTEVELSAATVITVSAKSSRDANAYGIRSGDTLIINGMVAGFKLSVNAQTGKGEYTSEATGLYGQYVLINEDAWTGGEIAVAAQNGKAYGILSEGNIYGDGAEIGGAVVAIGSEGATGIMAEGDNSNFTVTGAVYAGSSGNAAGLAASLAKQVGTNKSIASYAAKVRKEGGDAIKLDGSARVHLAAGSLVIGHLNFVGSTSLTISSSAQLCGDITISGSGENELNFAIDGPATRNAVITVVNDAGALKGDNGVVLNILIKAGAQAGTYILAQGNLAGVDVDKFNVYDDENLFGTDPVLKLNDKGDQLLLILSDVGGDASPLFGSGPELGLDQYPAFGAAAGGTAPDFTGNGYDDLKNALLAG